VLDAVHFVDPEPEPAVAVAVVVARSAMLNRSGAMWSDFT
jgi:hypothetical protein